MNNGRAAVNPDLDFKLFLKIFTSIPNKQDQLSSYTALQGVGQSSRIMNGV